MTQDEYEKLYLQFFSYIDGEDIPFVEGFIDKHKHKFTYLMRDGFKYALDNNKNDVVDLYLKDKNLLTFPMFNDVLQTGNQTYFNKVSYFLSTIKNSSIFNGSTVLHSAIEGQCIDIIKQIIEYIQPMAVDSYALELAFIYKHEESVDLLLPLCARHFDTIRYNLKQSYSAQTVAYFESKVEHYNRVIEQSPECFDGTNIFNIQTKIDIYQTLQQKKRLNDELAHAIETTSNSKRKM